MSDVQHPTSNVQKMRRLLMWNLVTLDGYFEGSKPWDLSFHELVWGKQLEQLSTEQLDGADTLLFGRVTYEGMAAYWPDAKGEGGITGRMNGIEKVVVSTTLTSADWNNSRVVRDVDAVEALKAGEGKDIFVFGSAILSDALTRRGLIDEYRIGIAPTLLGTGRRLFTEETQRTLKLLDVTSTTTGCAILRYAPA
jgi:dihydrofolate reductase